MVSVIRLAMVDSTRLPFWDHWAFIAEMASGDGRYSISQLWQQHNEHRIVIPKLLFLADFKWFRATGVFLLLCLVLAQVLHVWLFSAVVQHLTPNRLVSRMGLTGLVAAFLFSPVQLDNFVWVFQLSFILAALFCSASLFFFSAAASNEQGLWPCGELQPKLWFASLVSALFATLCLASGLFLWPILVLLCFLFRLRPRYKLQTIIAAFVVVAAYSHNYHSSSSHADPLDSLRHPGLVLQYLVLYLGGSWAIYGLDACRIIGAAGLLVVCLLFVYIWRVRAITQVQIFCASVILATTVTGVITALGRINFGLEQAFSSRYQTVAMIFWAALLVWCMSWAAHLHRYRSKIEGAVLLAFTLVLVGPLLRWTAIVSPYAARAGQWRVAEASVLSNVSDRAVMKAIHPDPAAVDPIINYLRQHRLSIFAGNSSRSLGQQFRSYYRVKTEGRCTGAVDQTKLLRNGSGLGYALSGWAWNVSAGATFKRIVLVDNSGRISGFGAAGYPHPSNLPPSVGEHNPGWFGFSQLEVGGSTVKAYGVFSDSIETCIIGETKLINSPQPYTPTTPAIIRSLDAAQHGIFRNGQWWFHNSRDVKSPVTIFGQQGDIPIVGDWDGSGVLRVGVFRKGQWWLDMNGNAEWDAGDQLRVFGQAGDIPVVGDWDGTGKLRIGVFRKGQWWLDMNGNTEWDAGDQLRVFGQAGDVPVVGDWDGTGTLRIGVFRDGQWWLDIDGDFKWTSGNDRIVNFGQAGDTPIVGNWDNAGTLRIGVFRDGRWRVDMNGNQVWDGPDEDSELIFGQPGDSTTELGWPRGAASSH